MQTELLLTRLQGMADEMPLGVHRLEDLYELAKGHLLHLRGFSRGEGLAKLRRILNTYGPEVGITHPRRGGYTVGRRASNPWHDLLAVEWQSVGAMLLTARALGFDLPEGDHAAKIEIGRGVRKVPGVKIRFRSGKHQYRGTSTNEG